MPISHRCLVPIKIADYGDEILCDVHLVDVEHIILGRPWLYDLDVSHNGRANTYTFRCNKKKIVLGPLEPKIDKKDKQDKKNADIHHMLQEFSEGDMVMIRIRPKQIHLRSNVFNVEDLTPFLKASSFVEPSNSNLASYPTPLPAPHEHENPKLSLPPPLPMLKNVDEIEEILDEKTTFT
ncbi:uncharacterized protein LOC131151422 [Malania oleifera]|uniref:uncharacterized protein LOC131151422 n=1 Tax=Malania oleifera TaxID=397392 RepID=UPI0025AE02C6|nr:uncharacterized protein LOC131151422 [Malania oleifera]